MKLKLTILAVCMALLAGCSGTPSESDMAEQIAKNLNKEVGVVFVEVENLEKLNGREDGEKYIADVSYDIEFTKSSKEVGEAGGVGMFGVKFKAGDTKHVDSQSLTFAQSENGWVWVK